MEQLFCLQGASPAVFHMWWILSSLSRTTRCFSWILNTAVFVINKGIWRTRFSWHCTQLSSILLSRLLSYITPLLKMHWSHLVKAIFEYSHQTMQMFGNRWRLVTLDFGWRRNGVKPLFAKAGDRASIWPSHWPSKKRSLLLRPSKIPITHLMASELWGWITYG